MFKIFSSKNQNSEVKNSGVWGDGQAVLGAVADGVLAIDPNGNIRIINPAAEKIIGWSNGDATGLNFESVFKIVDKTGRGLVENSHPIHIALRSFSKFESREFFLKTFGEKTAPISISINPIDSQNSGLVVVFRNIAKEIQENREQTEFISTASHEMRTPVASIEGYLGLALNPSTATIDQRARTYLEKAHENTKHLGQLFQDLLDISKAEDGRLKNEPVVLDAVEFSRDIWDGLKGKADEKNLEYIFELDEKKSGEKILAPVYYIRADRDHLREVLNNLFENAIKYTPSGRVSVGVSGDNENVFMSIKDSGIGIPAEDIPHLFQKFYRVDNSETREIGGTGLGLYLSRKLVEAIGGDLDLESEYKKGSVFTVRLPRLTREQAEKYRNEEKPVEKPEPPKVEIPEIKIEENQQSQQSQPNFQQYQQQYSQATQYSQPPQSEFRPQPQPQFQPQPKPQPQYYRQPIQAPAQNNPQTYQSPIRASTQINPQVRQQQYYSQDYQNPQPRQQQNPYFPQSIQPQNNSLGLSNSTQQSQLPKQPTLSDIEKMREEYVRKMMIERNRQA